MPPLLSLCMIVKNEAGNLPRCLASARGVVDEIVIVDTGSTDATVAIAEASGARVFHAAWENDFAKARNGAIARARGAWVVILDADEELDGSFRAGIRSCVLTTTAAALRVVVENFGPAGDVATSTAAPSVRVFRNVPAHRYERSIHEQVSPSILRAGGVIEDVELRVLHHGYTSDRAQGGSRSARNLALIEAELARCPGDVGLRVHLGLTVKAGGDFARARLELGAALGAPREASGMTLEARARALTALAQVELAAGAHAEADRRASEALRLDGENLSAAHVAAVARSFQGDLRGAVPLLEQVRRSPDTSPVVRRDVEALLAIARRAA
jgi:hypothetical protein